MAYLSQITSGIRDVNIRHGGGGVVSTGVELGEYLGGSYLAGRLNAQYPEQLTWRGQKVTYVGGLVGLGIAILADAIGIGGGWTPHVATLSTSFVGAHMASIGAEHGLRARAAAGPVVRSLPGGKTTAVGAIPQAAPGKYLDLEKISRVAAMHG